MQQLPQEILNKVLFPKYYKVDESLSINQKIYISKCLDNTQQVCKQITSLCD